MSENVSNYYQSKDLKFIIDIVEEYALKGIATKVVPTNIFGMPVYRVYIDIEDTHYKRNNEARVREFGKVEE